LKGKTMLAKLKALWSKLLSLFQRTPPPPAGIAPPAPAKPAVADFAEIRAAIDFLEPRVGTVTLHDLMVKLGRGLTPAEIEFAQGEGVYVRPDEKPIAGADNTGSDISDRREHFYKLADGESKTVTFTGSGVVRIIPRSGTQLLSVTDHLGERILSGTVSPYDRPATGSYTFSIKSIGGEVAVHLL
jgi:hypothetical protein